MSSKEIEYQLEIVRLMSLCRYAASELIALDDIISQRHPMSSGLPLDLVKSLSGQTKQSFVIKYKDLQEVESKLLDMLDENLEKDDFEDLKIESR